MSSPNAQTDFGNHLLVHHRLTRRKFANCARLVLWLTFECGFDSFRAHHFFNNLQMTKSARNQLTFVSAIPNDFAVSLRHFIGYDISIDIYGGPDVRMTNQLLLDGQRRPIASRAGWNRGNNADWPESDKHKFLHNRLHPFKVLLHPTTPNHAP